MQTVLAIDVGNSNICLGLFGNGKLIRRFRLSTNKDATSDELGLAVTACLKLLGDGVNYPDGVVVCNVVPPLQRSLEDMVEGYLQCVTALYVGPGVKTGFAIRAENPREVGADRIANAVAAAHKYETPIIIVDCGTATTFTVLDKQGFVGGAIAPGMGVAMDALYDRAAKLPRIEFSRPAHAIGKNTVQSMQVGAYYGLNGMVQGILSEVRNNGLGGCKAVATGGWSKYLEPSRSGVDFIDDSLTLLGLWLLWERNCEP